MIYSDGRRSKRRTRKYRRGPYLKRRGPVWHIMGSYLGVRLRESTFETDRARAEIVLFHRLAEIMTQVDRQRAIDRGEPPPPQKRTFWEACALYASSGDRGDDQYRRVRKVQKFYGPRLLCENFNQKRLLEGFEFLVAPETSEATKKRQVMTPVRSVLTLANAEWKEVQGCFKPNFKKMSDGKPRNRVIFPHEAAAMSAEAKKLGYDLLADILVIGFGEGPRRGELFKLEWRDIDIERSIVRFVDKEARERAKNTYRVVDDTRPSTLRMLRARRDRLDNPSGPIFLHPSGNRFASAQAFGNYLNRQLREVAKRVELEAPMKITHHVLRHSCASWHYSLDKAEYVKERMGWKAERMLSTYVHKVPRGMVPEVLAYLGLPQNLWAPQDPALARI